MKKLYGLLFLVMLILFFLSAASADPLVVYFSCTGTTEKVAAWIAEESNADLYRIRPETPYTEDDLKYYTDCRADREQADDEARPAIANLPESLRDYDVVFLGYPIWHGKAPKVMYTFLENIDISGKTIVPFCTSHSSPMGSSASILKGLTEESANWLEGRRFGKTAEKSEVTEWVQGLQLPSPGKKIYVTVNNRTMTATLSDNASAAAFHALLEQGDITIAMQDYGGFEKVGPLGTRIVQSDEQITTAPGDLILYQGDKVTVYYAENTWTFTKLGHIDKATSEDMKAFLGEGDPTVRFSVNENALPPSADMVLPDETREIKENAFQNDVFASVLIPQGTTAIGQNAFADCSNLREVIILSPNVIIDDDAFQNCTSLTVYGFKDSTAQTFAQQHGFEFKEVE